MKYSQIRHISQVDPDNNFYEVLAFNSERSIGELRTAVQLTNWDAVENFRLMEQNRSARKEAMARGRVKEGKPRPR